MPSLVSEYRRLLTADDSIATLDDAISLARRIALGKKSPRNGWPRILDEVAATSSPVRAHSANARRVMDAIGLLGSVASVTGRSDILEQQCSLFIDTLLLLFHQAYFVLLPKVMTSDRERLLQAFDSFAKNLPNRPDRFQVEGLVELELGNAEPATESFRAALAATHSDQQDFLTRVQMLWSILMERGEVSRAFACLQDIAPRVTRIDFDEFQGLVAATFAEAQRCC